MKIKLGVLLAVLLFGLVACGEVTPAQIEALQEKDAALEKSIESLSENVADVNDNIVSLSDDIFDIRETMLTEDDIPELGQPVFYEDPDLKVFLGDEDVTDEVDVAWIAKSDTGVVSFRVAVFDNSLSDEHGGILYIIPSEEFTSQIEFSGYDFFSIGAAMLSATYEESYIEDGFIKWVRLPEGHPMGRVPALVVFSESYGIFANEPIQRGPQIGIVFAIAYDKYDTPWNFYYGLDIIGTINVFQPR